MKKKIFTVLKLLFFLGIGVFFVWFFVKDLTAEEKNQIYESFAIANYWWILLCIFFALLSNVVRTLRWQMLIETIGYKPGFTNTFLSLMIAYFANLALPRLGEISRCGILNKYEKIPFEKSFGTVVAERALDLITYVILFFLNLFIQYDAFSGYVNEKVYQPLSEKFQLIGKGYFLYGFIALCVLFILFLIIFHSKLTKYKFYNKVVSVVKGFWEGIKSLGKIKKPFLFIVYTVGIWVLYYLMTYVCFFSLVLPSDPGMAAALSVLVMGTIGIMVVQGGIGIYPVIVAETLAIPAYGVNNLTGFTIGWLIWGAQTIAIIVAGIASLILLPVLNNKNVQPGKN